MEQQILINPSKISSQEKISSNISAKQYEQPKISQQQIEDAFTNVGSKNLSPTISYRRVYEEFSAKYFFIK